MCYKTESVLQVNMLYEGINSSLLYSLHVKLSAIIIATVISDFNINNGIYCLDSQTAVHSRGLDNQL